MAEVVIEQINIEDHGDGTVTVWNGSIGITADWSTFLDDSDPLAEAKRLVKNIAVSVTLSGKDPSKLTDLIEAAKTWSGKKVR